MADREDFRYGYPFINCTNCGPRYSIVRNIPYDRPNTTMSVFRMCDKCTAQYTDVTDRRFHAQPVACAACGPKIWLTDSKGKTIETQIEQVIAEAARLLLAGEIVAIKGIGGFHLAVDAMNNQAVERLRARKKRDHKPFAMMAGSIKKIREYAIVSEQAERLLKSPQSPIVLLPKKVNSPIASSVAEGVDPYGFMLCYAPLHYLLFPRGIEVLVMTSGNISDPEAIAAADLDNDGDVDLAVADRETPQVTVLLNNGMGQFTSKAFFLSEPNARFETPVDLQIADLDNDGWVDIRSPEWSCTTTVAGSSAWPTQIPWPGRSMARVCGRAIRPCTWVWGMRRRATRIPSRLARRASSSCGFMFPERRRRQRWPDLVDGQAHHPGGSQCRRGGPAGLGSGGPYRRALCSYRG